MTNSIQSACLHTEPQADYGYSGAENDLPPMEDAVAWLCRLAESVIHFASDCASRGERERADGIVEHALCLIRKAEALTSARIHSLDAQTLAHSRRSAAHAEYGSLRKDAAAKIDNARAAAASERIAAALAEPAPDAPSPGPINYDHG